MPAERVLGGKVTFRMRRPHPSIAILSATILAALLASPAVAEPIGNLRAVRADAGATPGWELSTDTGSLVRIEVLAQDIVRVQAGRRGKLTPAGDKAAPIVLPQPAAKVDAMLE